MIDADRAIMAIPAKVAFLGFTIELGLKTLIQRESGSEARGHDLASLFKKLPDELQSSLRSKTEKQTVSCSESFDKLLADNSFQFERFRYFHEFESLRCDVEFLGCFLIEINKAVVTT